LKTAATVDCIGIAIPLFLYKAHHFPYPHLAGSSVFIRLMLQWVSLAKDGNGDQYACFAAGAKPLASQHVRFRNLLYLS
jgi:hypothetical protein